MLTIAALVEGSHALHDSFAVIRWQTAGIEIPIVGLLWSESVLSEVAVFLVIGPRLFNDLAQEARVAWLRALE
jgi:PPP family 3-phenylpropionic acid transporter